MSLTNTQIGLIIAVVLVVGYLIYSSKCTEPFSWTVPSYRFVGCFKDNSERTIKGDRNKPLGRMTFNKCRSEAISKGKKFFGFQDPRMIDNGNVEGECWVSAGPNGNNDNTLINDAFKLGYADPINCYNSVNEKATAYNYVKLVDGANNNKGYKLISGLRSNDLSSQTVGGPWVNAVYTTLSQNDLKLPNQN